MTRQTPFTHRSLIMFLAASIALALASHLGVQNPFWAAMPVWVVAQPFRQDMLIRGLLRLLGTILGAGAAWGILYHLAPPLVQVLAVAGVLGLGTWLTYRIGTVYSYGALMTAITVVVVVFPALHQPMDARAYALDRILCTFLGVASVTVLSFAFTPLRAVPAAPPPAYSGPEARKRAGIAALAGLVSALLVGGVASPIALAAGFSLSIFALLIGATRDNRPILDNLVPGALIGVVAAVAYRLLATSLGLSGGALVMLALPFLAGGALLRCHPRTAPLGLDANMCFLLAAEAGAHGHPLAVHVTSGVALVAGASLVSALFGGQGPRRVLAWFWPSRG